MTYLQLFDAPLHCLSHPMDTFFVHEIKQRFLRLTTRPKATLDCGVPEHLHGALQLSICLVHFPDQLLEVSFAPVICHLQTPPEPGKDRHLINDGVAEKVGLGS